MPSLPPSRSHSPSLASPYNQMNSSFTNSSIHCHCSHNTRVWSLPLQIENKRIEQPFSVGASHPRRNARLTNHTTTARIVAAAESATNSLRLLAPRLPLLNPRLRLLAPALPLVDARLVLATRWFVSFVSWRWVVYARVGQDHLSLPCFRDCGWPPSTIDR